MLNCLALIVIGTIAVFRGISDGNTELIYIGVIAANIGFVLFNITKKLNDIMSYLEFLYQRELKSK